MNTSTPSRNQFTSDYDVEESPQLPKSYMMGERQFDELGDIIEGMLNSEQKYTFSLDKTCKRVSLSVIADEMMNSSSDQVRNELSSSPVSVAQPAAGNNMYSDFNSDGPRYEICKWVYKVVDHYSFDREIATVAMSYFDRMIWKSTSHSDDTQPNYELLAVTCLYTAVKLNEHRNKRGMLEALVHMSRRRFTVADITSMEFTMFKTLSWFLNPVTPQSFAQRFLELFPRSCCHIDRAQVQKVYDMSCYIIELSLFDSELMKKRPSAIAIAAIIMSLQGADSSKVSLESQTLFVTNLTSFDHSNDLHFAKSRMSQFLSDHHASKLEDIRATIDPNAIFYSK